MADITVLMITYNKAPFLARSVPVIVESMKHIGRAEFLLLNNGSTDRTPDVIDGLIQEYSFIKLYELPENIGLNGYGYLDQYSTGGIIFTADDDIFEAPFGWDAQFINLLSTKFDNRLFGYLGSDTINKDGGRQPHVWGYANVGEFSIEIAPVGGWLAATTRSVMDCVGGFHSGMPKMHLDDLDYQKRVWAAGYLCGVVTNIKVLHAREPEWYQKFGCERTYTEKWDSIREAYAEFGVIA